MYAICAYIDPPNHPNVGKYTIHGVSGYHILSPLNPGTNSVTLASTLTEDFESWMV